MLKKTHFICFIVLAVIIYIYASDKGLNTLRYVFKPLATILVLLLPVLFSKSNNKYKAHIILGLCFCLIGDVLLLFESLFIIGLIAFLIGHLIFIKAFTLFHGFIKNYKILALLLTYAAAYFIYIKDDLGNLLIPVIVYMLCILTMAWQGLSLYVLESKKTFKLIAIAVILFFISDSILAVDKFKVALPYANALIGITYWSAITLIAISTTFKADNFQQKS